MAMGLSICRAIIEAHGGRLWAKPRGALFQFTIPADELPSVIDVAYWGVMQTSDSPRRRQEAICCRQTAVSIRSRH
jgi:hypothetical protein